MMLEMDNSELLILLDSEHQLKAKARPGRWEVPRATKRGM